MSVPVGRVGVWMPSFMVDGDDGATMVAELEELGFTALWLGGANDLRQVERLLSATRRIVLATGITSIWAADATQLAADTHRISVAHPGRFLLGLGTSHEPFVAALGKQYERPLHHLAEFLDQLDAAPNRVPPDQRVLAALGPKALDLAAARSAGAHPYLVTPQHTHAARQRLGAGALLAPEQKVLLETNPATARRIARERVSYYWQLPNYVRNFHRMGFTEDDLASGGSDRLIDALVAWGTPDQIAARIAEHHEAGADHVSLQVLTADLDHLNRSTPPTPDQWLTLANALHLPPDR
ncbi:MAG: LLM class F420-dependent oxidoreductase [Catenulispora sp.]